MTPVRGAAIVELRAGPLRALLRPDVGGSIAGLWRDGVPVLRSVDDAAALAGPRQSACFALVPYSNRLGHRRFTWRGRDYTTQPNFEEPTPHSLHGVGWRRAWSVESAGEADATLRYDHAPDADWPFAFSARQHLRLHADALELGLEVENRADHDAPIGLGWHPYFPLRRGSRIALDVTARWEPDAEALPARRVPQGAIDAEVAALDLDHGFDGWSGEARIEQPAGDDDGSPPLRLTLRSSLGRAVVFTPPGRGFFCIEPVSHLADAIHRDDPAAFGLAVAAPGGRVSATLRLAIETIDERTPR